MYGSYSWRHRVIQDLQSYDKWTNAKRYAFQDLIVYGSGMLISLLADYLINILNYWLWQRPTHPMSLGLFQIAAVLVFMSLMVQSLIRWWEN